MLLRCSKYSDRPLTMNKTSPIIILGGRSLLTPYLLEQLAKEGIGATVTSRQEIEVPEGFKSIKLDLNSAGNWTAPQNAIIISLLPIWILTPHLNIFKSAKTIITVSSTSRYGKARSVDPREQEVVQSIIQAEQTLLEWTTPQGPSTTVLRPTLIYDGKTDANVTRIMRTIEKFGFFPLAKPANGKRQPIHAGDVATAILGAIDNKDAMNRAFNIAGGEVLTYLEMIERIFKHMGKPPRPLLLPLWLLKTPSRILSLFSFVQKQNFGSGIFERMNEDLIFDSKDGLKVLDYKPRKFLED